MKYSIKFNRRSGKPEPEPIYMIIRWKGLRLPYPTGLKISLSDWNAKSQNWAVKDDMTKTEINKATRFNSKLSKLRSHAESVMDDLPYKLDMKIPTVEQVRKELDQRRGDLSTRKRNGFFDFINNKIERDIAAMKSAGKNINRNSKVSTYRQTRDVLKDFEKHRNNSISFHNVDGDFYYDFIEYMERVKNYGINNIGKHIKTLKTFMREAEDSGLPVNDSYKKSFFKVLRRDADTIALNEKELDELMKLKLTGKEDKARDLFLLGCYTGLRYSDLTQLKHADIDGHFINIKTQKTEKRIMIPLHPNANRILSKYKSPPVMFNHDLNKIIKQVCKKIESLHVVKAVTSTKGGNTKKTEIPKYQLVSIHTARRTFATIEYKQKTPIYTIMAITGHKSEKAFLSYIKVSPNDHARMLQEIWQERYAT